METIKPLPGYVLVEPIEQESKSATGLYVPETDKDKPSKGKVIGVGAKLIEWKDSYQLLPYNMVKEGQTVIYKKWVNQEVEHEGKKYLLINFNELLAVLE